MNKKNAKIEKNVTAVAEVKAIDLTTLSTDELLAEMNRRKAIAEAAEVTEKANRVRLAKQIEIEQLEKQLRTALQDMISFQDDSIAAKQLEQLTSQNKNVKSEKQRVVKTDTQVSLIDELLATEYLTAYEIALRVFVSGRFDNSKKDLKSCEARVANHLNHYKHLIKKDENKKLHFIDPNRKVARL